MRASGLPWASASALFVSARVSMCIARRPMCRWWSRASAWSPVKRCSPTDWRRSRRARVSRIEPLTLGPAFSCRVAAEAHVTRRRTLAIRSPRSRPRIRVRRQRMRRRLSGFSVNRLVPNVLTLLALCAGMTAIRFAISGDFEAACYAILAAGIFDGLDGRMARLLKATSRFGAELDSLSDFVSFGVAPAAVLYLWTMSQLHSIGWAIVLFFAVCCALRLARFNTQLAAEPPPWAANFFSGAPAPAGAGLIMLPMFVSFEWGDWIPRSPYLNAVWISVVALLMVSNVPTVSLKRIRIAPQLVVPTLLGIGVATAF